MDLTHLLNAPAATVVVGGTLLATVLRCGISDCRKTIAALARLARPSFHAEQVRAELAGQVAQIRKDGVLRARFKHVGDAEFDEATDALIRTRSVAGLIERHDVHCRRRQKNAEAASRTLAQAADLGPVFGLAGTLVSLSQLPAEGVARAAFTGAISMAVLTTLYGLLIANIVFGPLSRAVERQAEDEEAARQEVIDWLAWQLGPALPVHEPVTTRSHHATHRAAPSSPQASAHDPATMPAAAQGQPIAPSGFAATRAGAEEPDPVPDEPGLDLFPSQAPRHTDEAA